MTFTEKQIADLDAPLNRANVKERSQAGRKLSYIEGWMAIAEANRIFGFDAWTRETMFDRCVAENPRKIGQAQRDGWSVSYIAKVRVTVEGVVREGIGAGHGIDVDLGLAHESAIKEAETDAMKRALMTFGNPFGLALYDKEQANVERSASPRREIDQSAFEDIADAYLSKAKADIQCFATPGELREWWEKSTSDRERAGVVKGTPVYAELWTLFVDTGKRLASNQQAAA